MADCHLSRRQRTGSHSTLFPIVPTGHPAHSPSRFNSSPDLRSTGLLEYTCMCLLSPDCQPFSQGSRYCRPSHHHKFSTQEHVVRRCGMTPRITSLFRSPRSCPCPCSSSRYSGEPLVSVCLVKAPDRVAPQGYLTLAAYAGRSSVFAYRPNHSNVPGETPEQSPS